MIRTWVTVNVTDGGVLCLELYSMVAMFVGEDVVQDVEFKANSSSDLTRKKMFS